MNKAHLQFMSNPTFCSLDELFTYLDGLDLMDRHQLLGPVLQQVTRTTTITLPPGASEEDGMQDAYDQFKKLAHKLSLHVHFAFVVSGIVSTTLVWLYGSSNEENFSNFTKSNRKQQNSLKQLLESGQLSQEEFDQQNGEIEERLNNLHSEMNLKRRLYDIFCEEVVSKIITNPPQD